MSTSKGFDAWLNEEDGQGGRNIDHLNTRTTDCCEVAFKAGYEWARELEGGPKRKKMTARELYYHRRRIARITQLDGEGNGDPKFSEYWERDNGRYPTQAGGWEGPARLLKLWAHVALKPPEQRAAAIKRACQMNCTHFR